MPAKSNLMELERPPRLEMKRTARDMANAPINALIPTKLEPRETPTPKRIADDIFHLKFRFSLVFSFFKALKQLSPVQTVSE